MTGWLLELFSILIFCNSRTVFTFNHVCIPLAEIALHFIFNISVPRTQWHVSISSKPTKGLSHPKCAWCIMGLHYPFFFLIDYKYMFKNPYTFDKFSLLIISPSLCSLFAICFTGDISQKLVTWATVTKMYLYPARTLKSKEHSYPLSCLPSEDNG